MDEDKTIETQGTAPVDDQVKADSDKSAIISELEKKEAAVRARQFELKDDGTEKHQGRVDALKKEEERIRSRINDLRSEKREIDKTLVEKLREENLDSALRRIEKEFGYDAETSKALLSQFKSVDSSAVTEAKIYADLRKAHVQLNAEKYLALEQEHKRLSEGADRMMASSSGSAAASGGQGDESDPYVDLDKADYEAARWAGMSIERYTKLKKEGKI